MIQIGHKDIFSALIIYVIGYGLEYCLNTFVSYHISPALFGDFS